MAKVFQFKLKQKVVFWMQRHGWKAGEIIARIQRWDGSARICTYEVLVAQEGPSTGVPEGNVFGSADQILAFLQKRNRDWLESNLKTIQPLLALAGIEAIDLNKVSDVED